MKIISGIYKGRVLEGFDIAGTRPTMDRVKESLFGMIQNNIPNSIVLDLFSGSGNLGIEALSQGAKQAYLVDNNKKAINIIKNNINNLKIENVKVINDDFKKALKSFSEEQFDLIFLDPPYKTNYIEESIKLIEKYNVLKKDGVIICESDNLDRIVYSDVYKAVKEKKYGDKFVVLLRKV